MKISNKIKEMTSLVLIELLIVPFMIYGIVRWGEIKVELWHIYFIIISFQMLSIFVAYIMGFIFKKKEE